MLWLTVISAASKIHCQVWGIQYKRNFDHFTTKCEPLIITVQNFGSVHWVTGLQLKKLRASHHLQNTKLWGDHGGKARAIYISIKYAHPCSHPCQWVCQIHCYCWLPNSSLVNLILSKHKSPTPSCSFSLQLKQWFSYTFLVISKNPNEHISVIKDCVCSLFFSPLAHALT